MYLTTSLKDRRIVYESVQPKVEEDVGEPSLDGSTSNHKRKRSGGADKSPVKRKSSRRHDSDMVTQVDSGEEDEEDDSLPPPLDQEPQVKDEIIDVDPHEAISSRSAATGTGVQEEDEKPDLKPRLQVSYSGFSIFGRTLVVM